MLQPQPSFRYASLTAYVGLYVVAKAKKGDCLHFSGSRRRWSNCRELIGCYVVGSAGSDEKIFCRKKKQQTITQIM